MTPEQAKTVDRLRNAAKEHGEVATLLSVLADALNTSIIDAMQDSDNQEYLAMALIAAAFSHIDRKGEE